MYVRSKNIKGHTYYYLVHGVREGGKVKQRVVLYLGKYPWGQSSFGGGGGGAAPVVFQGFTDVTTAVLDKLQGRSRVRKQFIADVVNDSGIRKAEREVIRGVLQDAPDEVPVQEFADRVRLELLPLRFVRGERPRVRDFRYEGVTLPIELRGTVFVMMR